jgi:hypothetical protein
MGRAHERDGTGPLARAESLRCAGLGGNEVRIDGPRAVVNGAAPLVAESRSAGSSACIADVPRGRLGAMATEDAPGAQALG